MPRTRRANDGTYFPSQQRKTETQRHETHSEPTVVPVEEDLPERARAGANGNRREITLNPKEFALCIKALQNGFIHHEDGRLMARKVGDGHVRLTRYNYKDEMEQEVITMPDSFTVLAYKAKIGG